MRFIILHGCETATLTLKEKTNYWWLRKGCQEHQEHQSKERVAAGESGLMPNYKSSSLGQKHRRNKNVLTSVRFRTNWRGLKPEWTLPTDRLSGRRSARCHWYRWSDAVEADGRNTFISMISIYRRRHPLFIRWTGTVSLFAVYLDNNKHHLIDSYIFKFLVTFYNWVLCTY